MAPASGRFPGLSVKSSGVDPKENTMLRALSGGLLGLVIFAAPLAAQEGVQRGKIKKVDADKETITLTVDGKDHEFLVTSQTRIVVSANRPSTKGLKDE